MKIATGENRQTEPAIGGSRVIAEVSLGYLRYETLVLGPNADELIVYEDTPLYTAETKTTVYATIGRGQLIISNENTSGMRIMEPGSVAQLPVGATYSLRTDTGVFRVLVHRETPAGTSGVLDLL